MDIRQGKMDIRNGPAVLKCGSECVYVRGRRPLHEHEQATEQLTLGGTSAHALDVGGVTGPIGLALEGR